MLFLRDYHFQNKATLVRCDFNVPIKDSRVLDDFKIQRTLPTINYLRKAGAKIILLSHLGRPEEGSKSELFNFSRSQYSLKSVAEHLEKLLKVKVKFSSKCLGSKAARETRKLKNGDILLLENLRLEQGEEKNDKDFAHALAELGECFVQEAFSVCHRSHASVVILPKLLPHFAGFTLEKEIKALSQVSQSPARPLVVIIGGIKIASKIKAIENFIATADHVLFGGKIANVILRVKGICLGKPWPEEEVVEKIKKIQLTNPKIHLPFDALASPDETGDAYIREAPPGSARKDEELFDIGKETINSFRAIIATARTIFWSGPLGLAENEKFSEGTREVAKAIIKNQAAFKVVGGGDTIAILRKLGLLEKFSYVSTGGSAMLAFVAGEKMPGLAALDI